MLLRTLAFSSVAHVVWGPLGLAPSQGPLYRELFSSPTAVTVIVSVQIAAGIALVVGCASRLAPLAGAVALWLLLARLPEFSNSGDYLARHLLFISVCFADTTRGKPFVAGPVGALHNAGLALGLTQACVLYLAAGLTKLATVEWTSGSALALIAAHPLYAGSSVLAGLVQHDVLRRATTLGVALHQTAWPLLLLTPLRKASLALTIGFHVMTACTMGLVTFAAVSIALDLFVATLVRRRDDGGKVSAL